MYQMRLVVREDGVVETHGVNYGREVRLHKKDRKYVVLRVKGGSVYMDRGSGTKYVPAEFVVCQLREEGPTGDLLVTKILSFPARA